MWLTPEDYFDFSKNCGIVYFQFDLPKLIDELYNENQIISGVTFCELNERCMHYYDSLIASCPEGTPFEQYLDENLRSDVVLLRKVLLKIHECFLDDQFLAKNIIMFSAGYFFCSTNT